MSSRLNHIQNWAELAKQAKWKASDLAKQCGVSLRTLERHFQQSLGKHPRVWLAEERLRQAHKLLREGSTVKEAANCLNYKHASHLTNGYKRQWGRSPTEKTANIKTKPT